jgi:hypothetical protein
VEKQERWIMIKFFVASNDPEQLYANIIDNRFIKDVEIQLDSNRAKGLPERYNELIDRNLNSDCWLVFLHDDVQLLEDLEPLLENVPKDIIYGACGAKKTPSGTRLRSNGTELIKGKGEIVGQIRAQDDRINNGNQVILGRKVDGYEIVSTFDPLCVILHTELLRKVPKSEEWEYRVPVFDENLGYHLFTEDLNINARDFGVKSAVLQINLIHYSWGTKTPEYYEALEYIKQKHGLKRFIGTCEVNAMDNSTAEEWE